MINDSFQETLPRPVPTPSRVAAGGEVETPSVKPGAPSALVAKPPKQTRQEKHCDLNGCEPILACYASMDPFIIFIYIYIFLHKYIYIYVGIGIKHASAFSGGNGQELLRNAAKAQVRMCTMKKKRTDLNVPQWVIDEYHKRPKNETAALLMSCNFDKARSAQLSVRIVPCCYLHVIYRVHQVINYMLYIYMSPMQLICVNMHEGIVYVDFCLGRLDLSLSWKSSSRRSPPKKLPSMKSG